MIKIGRDHGALRHEVGALPLRELALYHAHYLYEQELADAQAAKTAALQGK